MPSKIIKIKDYQEISEMEKFMEELPDDGIFVKFPIKKKEKKIDKEKNKVVRLFKTDKRKNQK